MEDIKCNLNSFGIKSNPTLCEINWSVDPTLLGNWFIFLMYIMQINVTKITQNIFSPSFALFSFYLVWKLYIPQMCNYITKLIDLS